MQTRTMVAAMAAALLAVAVPARAQEARTMPPVEFGGRVGGIGSVIGGAPLSGGVVTVRLTPRFAVEGDIAVTPTVNVAVWSGTGGFYQAGMRGRILGSREGVEWFWTAGVSGVFGESHVSGDSVRLFDRWTIDVPDRRDRIVTAPVMPTVGTGAIVPLASHLAVRADLRVLVTPAGPGVQTFVGLSVPIGRFGVSPRKQ
ncbi:MAG: hypothetical protein R2752_23940 [Vicinamibacterales bacterium]